MTPAKYSPTTKRASAGFTLIELMIVLMVLSILLLVAVPNYDSVMNSSKLDKARHNVAAGLAFTRIEAVERGANVSLCRGTTGSCGAGAGSTSWSTNGWKVVGPDGILRVDDSTNTGVAVTFECGDTMTYNAIGTLDSSVTGNECQFTFSDPSGATSSNYLCIAATGRVRMSDAVCE